MKKKPFFIIGTKRGGTTLLRMMVNSHPALAVPPESHFLIPMLKQVPMLKPLGVAEQKKVRNLILSAGRFNTWQTTEEELMVLFDSFPMEIRFQDIIDAVFRLEIQKMGKSRWGDKTPEYLQIIDGLGLLFPEAKFIFLVRDGRDVIDSLKAKGWEGWSVFQRSKYWADGIKGIRKFMMYNPRNSLLVKYEDLVLYSEQELRKICDFLEEDYSPTMLEYHKDFEQNITAVEKENKIHTKLGRLPSRDDIQKWKKKEHSFQLFLTESVMYKELKAMDYELAAFNPIQPVHQIQGSMYHVFNVFNGALFFIYHRILGSRLKRLLSNTLLGKTLRKMVRST